jgi:hypothetical protein
MISKIRNIGFSLVTVFMMSACGTDDVVTALAEQVADLEGSDIGSTIYTGDTATSLLTASYVMIIKNISEEEVSSVRVAVEDLQIVGNTVIRVDTTYACANLGLTQEGTPYVHDNSTMTKYSGGGKFCYELVYSSGSSKFGTSNIAYSTEMAF